MKRLFVYLILVSSAVTGVPAQSDQAQDTLQALKLKECQNTPSARKQRIYPLPRVVSGLTTTSKGNLAIVNDDGQRVDIFSKKGKFIQQLDVAESNRLFDIARKQDLLFLPEYHAQSIHIVHEDNRYIANMNVTQFGYSRIWGVAITGDTLWLTSPEGLYKVTFDVDYKVTESNLLVPTKPWINARFRISALPSHIVLTDGRANSLYYFYHNGTQFLPPTTGVVAPWGIATDSCGRHFVAEVVGERISLVSETGQIIKVIVNSTTESRPSEIVYYRDTLYVIENKNLNTNSSLFVVDLK